MEPKQLSFDGGIDTEIQWGKHYRQQKKQSRRVSMVPTSSPLNIQHMWERYQVTKQLLDIERLKLELPPPKPVPNFVKLSRLKTTQMCDRAGFSRKQYIDYLAKPRQYHLPKEATLGDKANALKQKLKTREACSPRLVQIAKPTKNRVLHSWIDYQKTLPIDFITRLDELLRTDHTLDPKFARCCFRELDRKQRLKRKKLRRKRKKELKKKEAECQKWLKLQIETTAGLIANFFEREPLLTLNFKQMLLSTVILTELYNRGDIKRKPTRNTNNPYHQTIVDVVDQLAVWMDTIFRYVDVQYTESMEDFLQVPSLESMLGEEEEEEEEEEEFGEGEEFEAKRFSLPPLPPLPPMEPGLKPIYDESEGETDSEFPVSVYEGVEGGKTETGESRGEGSESELGDSELEGGELEDGELDGGESDAEGGRAFGSIDEDMMQVLVKILSATSPDVLAELIDSEKLPNITYQDILNRIRRLQDQEQVRKKQEHKELLEETLLTWAKNNDPDRVNERLMNKIQDAAAILAECLLKEAAVDASWASAVSKSPKTSITEETIEMAQTEETTDLGQAEDLSDKGRTLDILPEEDTNVTEDEVSDITSAADNEELEQKPEAIDEDEVSDITSVVEKEELEELHQLAEGVESDVSAWIIKPTGSLTKLPTIATGKQEDKESTPTVSMDMTGALKVVMSEVPEPDRSAIGIGMLPHISEEEEVSASTTSKAPSIRTALELQEFEAIKRDDVPGMIPGHQPSHVFEHAPDTICCLTLKVYTTWLLEVAHNAHAWSRWLSDIVGEIRRIASIIRGDIKDDQGKPILFYKEDWIKFGQKVEKMIVSWRQYSMHVKDLTDKITPKFRGKKVACCPKCMHDNLISDVAAAHGITEQLAEALNTTTYWRRWLDDIIMETKRLTTATVPEVPSDTSSYGTVELVELHQPQASMSEESLYEIEELGSSSQNF